MCLWFVLFVSRATNRLFVSYCTQTHNIPFHINENTKFTPKLLVIPYQIGSLIIMLPSINYINRLMDFIYEKRDQSHCM